MLVNNCLHAYIEALAVLSGSYLSNASGSSSYYGLDHLDVI